MRTVTLNNPYNLVLPRESQEAIDYLAGWAAHSERYCKADIFVFPNSEISACYMDDAGSITYQIMGVPSEVRGARYSFHS